MKHQGGVQDLVSDLAQCNRPGSTERVGIQNHPLTDIEIGSNRNPNPNPNPRQQLTAR